MKSKTDPVSIMADSSISDKMLGSSLGRIFIVLLQTVLFSQVLLFSFFLQGYVDITLMKYIIVLLIGLLAGFSARRLLPGHTRTLEFLTALISAALSLGVLFALSGGFLGIDLLSGLFRASDWNGLFQFALAALGAFLVINSFRPRSAVEETPAPPAPVLKPAPAPKTGIKGWLPKLTSPRVKKSSPRISGQGSTRKKPASSAKSGGLKVAAPKTMPKAAAPAKLTVAPPPAAKKKRAAKPKKNKVKKEIKLVGEMEHICPYCLDPVQDHDPRGVKICPQCKTRHHADCWGITGACQIPHSHK